MDLFTLDKKPYQPQPIPYFHPQRIILTKGSQNKPEYCDFIEKICSLYPDAEVVNALDLAHNRVNIEHADPLKQHYSGKNTLVFGLHRSAVRSSDEDGNTCPNYWHFSPYGFCPYDCQYCYLAGTPGVKFSPSVKIFLNLGEILQKIDKAASRADSPVPFYLGKLQDGLAMDPLTGYSRQLVPFFANHSKARLTVLTKSTIVDNLLNLDHRGHTILSWTVNAPEIHQIFEPNTPSVSERIIAMKKCAQAGFPVRAIAMPIIPIDGWKTIYTQFLEHLLNEVPLQRITFGGICIYQSAQQLMELKLSKDNPITDALDHKSGKCSDGRVRFSQSLRNEIYRHMIDIVRKTNPDLKVALCLEEKATFESLGLSDSIGRCNCVL